MKLTNSFERYYILLSLLIRENFPSTPENISHLLGLPIQQIRLDFKELMNSSVIRSHMLFLTDDCEAFSVADYFFENLSSSAKASMASDFLSGIYDKTIFSLDGYELGFDMDSILFPIDHIEHLALKNICPDFVQNISNQSDVFQKHGVISISSKQKDWAKKIETALKEHKGLRLLRQTRQGLMEFKIMPKRIFRDTNENTIYCIDSNGCSHPLNTIYSVTFIPPFDKTETKDLDDYLWGISCDVNEKVEDVALIIENATPNLLKKIEADVSRRKHGKLNHLKNNDFIYTDKIIGMNSFKRWIRSYGSAIIVQSPKHLAIEMYESARKMYENYTSMEFK